MEPSRSWDAVETAEHLRRGEVSAREVVDAAISRAEAAAALGAVVTPTWERARAAAGAGGSGPFAGVPTFIKDLSHLEGVPISWGSRGANGFVSRRSDPSVQGFLDLGFVALGKTATPEFGLTATTEPLGRPPCRNPWAPDRTAGGSSGGAAALVAAGVVPLAHASDGGGSIRVPAAACGLVGLKPSRLRLDMAGSQQLPVNVACDGVVTRTVRDTVAFWSELEALRRPKGVAPMGAVPPEPPRGLRVGLFTAAPLGTPVHPEHRDAALAAGALLRSLGHQVEEIAPPFGGGDSDAYVGYWTMVAWMQVRGARLVLHRGFDVGQVDPWTLGLVRRFSARKWAATRDMLRVRGLARRAAAVFERFDVLLCPTLAHPPPPLGHLAPEVPFETALARLVEYTAFTPLYNGAGIPALSLPWTQSTLGTPVGVQLAAAHGRDATLLSLALAIEAAHPWERVAPEARWRS